MESALELIGALPRQRDSLIPALQGIQEIVGYIPPEIIPRLARHVGVMPVEVQGVATFYAQFSLTPRGRNIVRVCRGTACHVRGGRGVLRVVRSLLGIEEGETSSDLKFTLESVACLGACALAPVMVVNKTYYGKMNPKRIEVILGSL
jgi:NADH:ubiquinone oxidoreductase subunit E